MNISYSCIAIGIQIPTEKTVKKTTEASQVIPQKAPKAVDKILLSFSKLEDERPKIEHKKQTKYKLPKITTKESLLELKAIDPTNLLMRGAATSFAEADKSTASLVVDGVAHVLPSLLQTFQVARRGEG